MAGSRTPADPALRRAIAEPDPDDPTAAADLARPWAIAFSGGLDSTVLLHAAVRVAGADRVLALHVHHGLQPAADAWVGHATQRCQALGVRLRVLRIEGRPPRGTSVEAWARSRRYALMLAAARDAGAAALLTAHHRDDQIETVLLRLARGCGLDGIGGIVADDRREGVRLLRPFLSLDREALRAEALERGLHWIEDPSNADLTIPRNAVRARVLPALDATLPGLRIRLPETLAQLADARQVVGALARADLREAAAAGCGAASVPRALDRARLAALPAARLACALRAWLAALGAPAPPARRLSQMSAQLVHGASSRGEIEHAGWCLVRQGGRIVAWPRSAQPLPVADCALAWTHDALALPDGSRVLAVDEPGGLCEDWLRSQPLRLACAPSSARLRPVAGGPSRTLKNLRQEAGLPPRLRATWPAIYVGDRLLWAAPFGRDRDPSWPTRERGVALRWIPEAEDPRSLFGAGARLRPL